MRNMVQIVNFSDTPRTAFVRGFWKGMAAPLMLFGSSAMPVEAQPMEFKPLPIRPSDPGQDWARVGDLLRAATSKDRAAGGY